MKLYFSRGACSLAAHIALHEVGVPFDSESVDLKTGLTASGSDFDGVSVKGYVPALVLDDGDLVTENIAILDYLAGLYPQVALQGLLGRTRLLEALAYISIEIHKSYKPFWRDGSDSEKAAASAYITKRFQYLADRAHGAYLFADQPTVADFYLFVTLLWAKKFGVEVPAALETVYDTLRSRPAVRATLSAEGLN